MRQNAHRLPFALLLAITITACVAGLDAYVWFSRDRTVLEEYSSFVVTIGVPAITLCAYVVKRRPFGLKARPPDYLADLLAEEVKAQWTEAAAERQLLLQRIPVRWARSSQGYAWSPAAAAGSKAFAPLPGIKRIGTRQLKSGDLDDLHNVYGGLGSGRLLIVGAPGSGKTGAAVLLTLAALKHRENLRNERKDWRQVPVPVLFTLHGWDPALEPMADWIAKRLQQTYSTLFPGKRGIAECSRLVRDARVTVILDGLDEVPAELQRSVLNELNRHAVFRVIVLTRNARENAIAPPGALAGAVALELQEVDPRDAKKYLLNVLPDPLPGRSQELIERLSAPSSAMAAALNKPLTLTLVRDIYGEDGSVSELLEFSDSNPAASPDDIESFLLDRLLPSAYRHHARKPRPQYDLDTAERVLSYIAAQMKKNAAYDLAWWEVPSWASAVPRVILSILLAFIGFVYLELTGGQGPASGISSVIPVGLLVFAGIAGAGLSSLPTRVTRSSLRVLYDLGAIIFGLAFGVAGFVAGLAIRPVNKLVIAVVNWVRTGPVHLTKWPGFHVAATFANNFLTGFQVRVGLSIPASAAIGLVIGLGAWLFMVIVIASAGAGENKVSPLSPVDSWRRDRVSALIIGLGIGLVSELVFGFLASLRPDPSGVFGLGRWPPAVFACGPIVAILVTLIGSQTWAVALAFTQLAVRRRTPVRLMRFLEDARERDILRTVGPVYQFRHARLQDRLAIRGPLTSHFGVVSAVAVGTRRGRPVVVSGGYDATVRVWDLESGEPVLGPLTGHAGVLAVAIGERNGRPVIISGGNDKNVSVWDLESGDPVFRPLTGHADAVIAVAVSTRGGRPVIVSGARDGSVRICDLESGDLVLDMLTGHWGMQAVTVGERLGRPVIVTGGSDGKMLIWDLESGVLVFGLERVHTEGVNAAAVGERHGRPVIVTGGGDGKVEIWDLESPTRRPVSQSRQRNGALGGLSARVFQLFRGHLGGVNTVTVGDRHGQPVTVSGGRDGTVRIWDLDSGTRVLAPIRGHRKGVNAVTVGSRHGQPVVVSGGDDGTVRIWDAQSGAPVERPLTGDFGR